jgi:hypothetical protein
VCDLFRLAADNIFRCIPFEDFNWLSHGFGTRMANPPADVTLRQIHSAILKNAAGLRDLEHEGDALITNQPHRTIGIRTADCVPILLLDSSLRAVAAIHAGWRGSASEIVTKAVQQLTTDFGSQPDNIHAAIGPCIRECCYEVSSDVADQFTRWTTPLVKANGKPNLNLAEVNARQLESAGVPSTQMFDSGLCTFCNAETFYSFRRDPLDPGRMLSAIAVP